MKQCWKASIKGSLSHNFNIIAIFIIFLRNINRCVAHFISQFNRSVVVKVRPLDFVRLDLHVLNIHHILFHVLAKYFLDEKYRLICDSQYFQL